MAKYTYFDTVYPVKNASKKPLAHTYLNPGPITACMAYQLGNVLVKTVVYRSEIIQELIYN